MKKIIIKSAKVIGYIILSIVILFAIIVLLIQIPSIQNRIKDVAISYLEGKIETKVELSRIEIALPKSIVVKELYMESQQNDTLLYVGNLSVDVNFYKLLFNTIDVNSIVIGDFVANIKRDTNNQFNFDYIIDAFATEKKPKNDSKPFSISLNRIDLNNISVTFDDKYDGNDLFLKFNKFSTKIKKFDLEKMSFSVPKIQLDGLKTNFHRYIVDKSKTVIAKTDNQLTEKKTNPLSIELGDIDLSNIDVEFDDAVSKLYSTVNFNNLSVNVKKVDLLNRDLAVNKIKLNDSKAVIRLLKNLKDPDINKTKDKSKNKEETVEDNSWKLSLNDLSLNGFSVLFDDDNAIVQPKGMDYKHLNFSNIDLELKDFKFDSSNISGTIKSAKIREKRGLNIEALKTEFTYGSKTAFLKDFYLKTPKTTLQREVVLTYDSPHDLSANIGNIGITTYLKNCEIGFDDILLFVPDLEKQDLFKNNLKGKLSTNFIANGKVKNLNIKEFYAKLLESTLVSVSGNIKGLPNIDKAYLDINIKDLHTTDKDLINIIPAKILPKNIQLPEILAVNGDFKGYIDNFNTKLKLNSSYGSVSLISQFDKQIKDSEKYRIDAVMNNFNVGKLIKNDSLGAVSLSLQASGIGLNPELAEATFSTHLLDAYFNNYQYKNLSLSGNISGGQYNVLGGIKDSNIEFAIKANGQIKGEEVSLKMNADIDKVNLYKLNLNADPLAVKGNITADFSNLNPDKLDGVLTVENLALANDKQIFALEPIYLKSICQTDSNKLSINSQLADIYLEGKYQLTKLPKAFNKTISKYFDYSQKDESSSDNEELEEIANQDIRLDILFKESSLLYQIVPKLKNFKNIKLKGEYISNRDYLQLHGGIESLKYDNNHISAVVFDLNTDDKTLKYNLYLGQFQSSNFEINRMLLNGNLKNNLLNYNLKIKDDKEESQFIIAGSLESLPQYMRIKLIPDGFKLNYEKWNVSTDNIITIGKEGINVQSFELLGKDGKIKLQSQSQELDSPLKIDFVNFDIQSITEMVKKDSLSAKGIINGGVELRNITKDLLFVSDIKISNLEVMGAKVGNLDLEVDNRIPNRFDVNMGINGEGNKISIEGFYETIADEFSLKIDVNKFQMSTIEGFSMGNLTNSKGYLSGILDLKGKTTNPNIYGKIQFNDVGIKVVPINSTFNDINESIDFTDTGMLINNFTITDSNHNKLIFNGRINTPNYKKFKFDLDVLADNFKAINSTEKDNDFFYGDLFLAVNLKITGDTRKPEVNGQIGINKNTNFTMVMPQNDPSVANREGVVEFIDQNNKQLLETLDIKAKVDKSDFRGMDVLVSIHTDEDAQINIVIDKLNGDNLKLKGKADLTGGIDPSGKTTLTGSYEFTSGSYDMSFNFIKKKFIMQKGSSIVWTGEPTKATLDLTAIYDLKAAPIDLLDKQLSDLTPSIKNMYKQKLSFHTLLMIKGELLKPEITFDIKLAEDNASVSAEIISNTKAKLEQLRLEPSDLNKQVFALLVLNRFMGENPFSGGANSVESISRESVSKMLSEQLNNLASDLIGGVEMDFDLQSTEYYSTGEKENRTDLNVGLSKKLLNDRLKITIGSSFGLEGTERKNEKSTNIAGDISAEYMLSKDGRYILRAYRKNKYQVALQGQIVETGLGFIITMSYEHFIELFQAQSDKKGAENTIKSTQK